MTSLLTPPCAEARSDIGIPASIGSALAHHPRDALWPLRLKPNIWFWHLSCVARSRWRRCRLTQSGTGVLQGIAGYPLAVSDHIGSELRIIRVEGYGHAGQSGEFSQGRLEIWIKPFVARATESDEIPTPKRTTVPAVPATEVQRTRNTVALVIKELPGARATCPADECAPDWRTGRCDFGSCRRPSLKCPRPDLRCQNERSGLRRHRDRSWV